MRAPTVGTTKPGGAESFIILEERTAEPGARDPGARAFYVQRAITHEQIGISTSRILRGTLGEVPPQEETQRRCRKKAFYVQRATTHEQMRGCHEGMKFVEKAQ